MIKLGYSIDTRGATSRSVPPALGLRSSRWLGGVAATSYYWLISLQSMILTPQGTYRTGLNPAM